MNKIIPNDAQSPEVNRGFEGNKPSKDIFGNPNKRQKPQISSIPGVSLKEPNRYQVKIRDEIVATKLSGDEALAFIKAGVSR